MSAVAPNDAKHVANSAATNQRSGASRAISRACSVLVASARPYRAKRDDSAHIVIVHYTKLKSWRRNGRRYRTSARADKVSIGRNKNIASA